MPSVAEFNKFQIFSEWAYLALTATNSYQTMAGRIITYIFRNYCILQLSVYTVVYLSQKFEIRLFTISNRRSLSKKQCCVSGGVRQCVV